MRISHRGQRTSALRANERRCHVLLRQFHLMSMSCTTQGFRDELRPATVADLFDFENNQKEQCSVGHALHGRGTTGPYPVTVPDAYNCPRRVDVTWNRNDLSDLAGVGGGSFPDRRSLQIKSLMPDSAWRSRMRLEIPWPASFAQHLATLEGCNRFGGSTGESQLKQPPESDTPIDGETR